MPTLYNHTFVYNCVYIAIICRTIGQLSMNDRSSASAYKLSNTNGFFLSICITTFIHPVNCGTVSYYK